MAEHVNPTTAERVSERELVVTRLVDGPVHLVYRAWATPELFRRWWAPASFCVTIVSYEAEIRTGGHYRLTMAHPSHPEPMAFFGRYLDVVPDTRIVWTNDEAGEPGPLTTVSFVAQGEATEVTVRELYPSKEALDEAIASGSTSGWPEQFTQLDELLAGCRSGPTGPSSPA